MNEQPYRPTAAIALIVSPDALGAALLGAAVELAGYAVTFVNQDETTRQALRRVRPTYLLLDAADDAACAGDVLGPAMMTGARSILFGSAARVAERQALIRQYTLEVLVMPRDAERCAEVLGGRSGARAR